MSAEAIFEWDKAKWKAFAKRIKNNVNSSRIDKILEDAAYNGQKHIASTMPWKSKKTIDRSGIATSWYVLKKKRGEYKIASTHKVAFFLEDGTKAHGPRVKKCLYIPLRPGAATWREGFVLGKDYILVKRVKGIKARKYLKPISLEILGMMVSDFEAYIAKAAG
jgi:hypothetical protein